MVLYIEMKLMNVVTRTECFSFSCHDPIWICATVSAILDTQRPQHRLNHNPPKKGDTFDLARIADPKDWIPFSDDCFWSHWIGTDLSITFSVKSVQSEFIGSHFCQSIQVKSDVLTSHINSNTNSGKLFTGNHCVPQSVAMVVVGLKKINL